MTGDRSRLLRATAWDPRTLPSFHVSSWERAALLAYRAHAWEAPPEPDGSGTARQENHHAWRPPGTTERNETVRPRRPAAAPPKAIAVARPPRRDPRADANPGRKRASGTAPRVRAHPGEYSTGEAAYPAHPVPARSPRLVPALGDPWPRRRRRRRRGWWRRSGRRRGSRG